MATWIAHLRIAEQIFLKLPALDEVSFLYGNLAPDSGYPNEDRTQFVPPKQVTHFLTEDRGEEAINDLVFYRDYLQGMDAIKEKQQYSLRFGYYIHLLTDQFWWKKIVCTTKMHNQELFSNNSLWIASAIVKTDWYDLDHKFLRDHPDYAVWKTFFENDIPQLPLPILSQNAFEIQMKYIKEYYTTPDPERQIDRVYPYLNEQTLDHFIKETSAAIIKILEKLEDNIHTNSENSSLVLLSKAEISAYNFPLGDTN